VKLSRALFASNLQGGGARCINVARARAHDDARLPMIVSSHEARDDALSRSRKSADATFSSRRVDHRSLLPRRYYITGYGILICKVDRGGTVHKCIPRSCLRLPPWPPPLDRSLVEQFATPTRAKVVSFRLGKQHPYLTSGAYDG